jgi:hypothetical protein
MMRVAVVLQPSVEAALGDRMSAVGEPGVARVKLRGVVTERVLALALERARLSLLRPAWAILIDASTAVFALDAEGLRRTIAAAPLLRLPAVLCVADGCYELVDQALNELAADQVIAQVYRAAHRVRASALASALASAYRLDSQPSVHPLAAAAAGPC